MTHREFLDLEDAMLFDRSHELEFKVRESARVAAERSMASRGPWIVVFAEPLRFSPEADTLTGREMVQVAVDTRWARDLRAASLLAEEQIRRVLRGYLWARLPEVSR
jgi:hypothetical protein